MMSNIKQSCGSFDFGLVCVLFPFDLAIIHPRMPFLWSVFFVHSPFFFFLSLWLFRANDVNLSRVNERGVLISFQSLIYILVIMTSKGERMTVQTHPKELISLMRKECDKWTQNLDPTSGNPVMELGLCRKCCPECVFHFTSLWLWFCVDSFF